MNKKKISIMFANCLNDGNPTPGELVVLQFVNDVVGLISGKKNEPPFMDCGTRLMAAKVVECAVRITIFVNRTENRLSGEILFKIGGTLATGVKTQCITVCFLKDGRMSWSGSV